MIYNLKPPYGGYGCERVNTYDSYNLAYTQADIRLETCGW